MENTAATYLTKIWEKAKCYEDVVKSLQTKGSCKLRVDAGGED